MINEQGGITINGDQYMIELVVSDTKSTLGGAKSIFFASLSEAFSQYSFPHPFFILTSSSLLPSLGVCLRTSRRR
jgi:hypothetical protein